MKRGRFGSLASYIMTLLLSFEDIPILDVVVEVDELEEMDESNCSLIA